MKQWVFAAILLSVRLICTETLPQDPWGGREGETVAGYVYPCGPSVWTSCKQSQQFCLHLKGNIIDMIRHYFFKVLVEALAFTVFHLT